MFKKSKILRTIRFEMIQKASQLMVAQQAAGLRSPDTLWRWRKKHARVDRYILKCITLCENKRITAVEDAQFKSAISGNTKAQETFLFNRAPDKWKRGDSGIRVGVQVSQNMQTSPVKQLKDEELDVIITRR